MGDMAKHFSGVARKHVDRMLDPVGARLARWGVSPNIVTVVGTAAVVAGAVFLVTRGHLLAGLIVITLAAFTDLIDGAMARAKGTNGRFGAFLDSTMDRLADGAVFGALTYWLATTDQRVAAAGALCCLIGAQLVSYVRSRAESLGASCDVGIAERAERLVILGVGTILTVIGVPLAMPVTLWILTALIAVTVAQRIWRTRSQLNGDST